MFKKYNFLGLFVLAIWPLFSKTIDVIADFKIDGLPINWKKFQSKEVEFRSFKIPFSTYLQNHYSDDVEKVIFMNEIAPVNLLAQIPKEKLVLFLWEPRPIYHNYCSLFSLVYTFNDTFVNNQLYQKFYYPFFREMIPNMTTFSEKKLCTLVVGNWTKERIKVVNSFIRITDDDFEFWGRPPGPFRNCINYKGEMPGAFSSQLKISALNGYRFCICFESSKIPGYITEKIFDCLAAGCVPIYWGSPNIKNYIPEDCFIDYESFLSDKALYSYIKNMTEERHQEYIQAINRFLESDMVKKFTPTFFESLIDNIIDG